MHICAGCVCFVNMCTEHKCIVVLLPLTYIRTILCLEILIRKWFIWNFIHLKSYFFQYVHLVCVCFEWYWLVMGMWLVTNRSEWSELIVCHFCIEKYRKFLKQIWRIILIIWHLCIFVCKFVCVCVCVCTCMHMCAHVCMCLKALPSWLEKRLQQLYIQ